MEGWPSGRRHPPTKRTWVLTTHLGFESLALRQVLLTKGNCMAQPKQTATELSRTLAGQWSKSEKRAEASRSIMNSKKRTHEIIKAFKNKQILSK